MIQWKEWVQESKTFVQQVIQEGRRVIWPTRGDVLVTSVIVFVLSIVISFFLFVFDQVILKFLAWLLEVGPHG